MSSCHHDGLWPFGYVSDGSVLDKQRAELAWRMPPMERYAAILRPSFSVCQVSHWFTFMFSSMSINMLMMSWERVCERACKGVEGRKRAVRKKLLRCEIALVCQTNGWKGGWLFQPAAMLHWQVSITKESWKLEVLLTPAPLKPHRSSAWTCEGLFSSGEPRAQALEEQSLCVALNPGPRERASFWCGIISNKCKGWGGRRGCSME